MRSDASQADPRSQVGAENKNSKSQRRAAAGERVVTLSKVLTLLVVVALGLFYIAGRGWAQSNRGASTGGGERVNGFDSQINGNAQRMFEQGRQIFRFETFGDEAYWSDKLKLHEAIEGAKLGGVGPGVSPKTALAVGLKVDMDALPADLVVPAESQLHPLGQTVAEDQFGDALATQPVFTWALTGRGSLTRKGLYTAPRRAGGPFTVTASAGGVQGTATVTVVA